MFLVEFRIWHSRSASAARYFANVKSTPLLSGCRDVGFGVCGTDERDLCPPPVWTAARTSKEGRSGQPSRRSPGFFSRQPCPRRRTSDAVRIFVVPARLLQHSADRPRRSAVCAGDQANGRKRRFRRYPLPGRRALQEAGRHLLDAGGRGRNRLRAGPAARPGPHLDLPRAVADRRVRRHAADLLDGACFRHPARRHSGRADHGQFSPARRRGAARQDRRDAAVDRRGRDGSDGAGLSVLAARRRFSSSALDMAGHFLDGVSGRHPASRGR